MAKISVDVRGSSQDYDDWAIIAEDEGWSAKDMKLYMKKHQTLEPIPDHVVDRATMPFVGENHGTSGPARTSFNESFLPIEHDFIKACDEVTGYKNKPVDPWSGDHIGKSMRRSGTPTIVLMMYVHNRILQYTRPSRSFGTKQRKT